MPFRQVFAVTPAEFQSFTPRETFTMNKRTLQVRRTVQAIDLFGQQATPVSTTLQLAMKSSWLDGLMDTRLASGDYSIGFWFPETLHRVLLPKWDKQPRFHFFLQPKGRDGITPATVTVNIEFGGIDERLIDASLKIIFPDELLGLEKLVSDFRGQYTNILWNLTPGELRGNLFGLLSTVTEAATVFMLECEQLAMADSQVLA